MTLLASINPAALNWKQHMYDVNASMDKAMRQTDWPALCQLAATLRNNVPCVPLDYATNGLNNMARLLEFTDGVLWVARVSMRRSAAASAKLRSEVDTMLWIRQHSSLPVPDVFACETDANNAVGVPFVLMSFVPGNTAMDCHGGFEAHRSVIPFALRPRFYSDVAACHVKMTSLRLPQIGTVRRTANGTFEAGPIPGIGGPFDTATDFFAAWADQACFPRDPDFIRDIMRGAPETQQVLHAIETFVPRLRALAPRLAHARHDGGPFPLCHPDFLHSNIIVDESTFAVHAVIDWEGACTLPWPLVRFPRFLDAQPRRFSRASAYGADEQQRCRERQAYIQTVAALEAEERGPGGGGADGAGPSLAACLADEQAQALSYAMGAFENGKLGFYDQLLDDLEQQSPVGK